MMIRSRAFSLIELMVVIAIVGVLSVAAVPSYRDYITRVKIVNGVTELQSLRTSIKQYYSTQGSFPALADLGMTSPIPTSLAEYFTPHVAFVVVEEIDTGFTCPAGSMVAYISRIASDPNVYLGTGDPADVVVYSESIYEKNSMIQSECVYQYFQIIGGVPTQISGDFIPGCLNLLDNPSYDSSVTLNSC